MPAADQDRATFSERLRAALKRAPKSIESASQLAHEFNLRYRGEPITDQAAQKWLTGKARPAPDKLDALAAMLGVSAFWLKNGTPPAAPPKKQTRKTAAAISTLSERETQLILRLRSLSDRQSELVGDLVEQLALERELAGH
jgi:transcriptional regulator with XRE-family HTH domain